MWGEADIVRLTKRTILSLSGILLLALWLPGPAWGGPWDQGYRNAAQSQVADSRRNLNRDHHRGRSFTDRRSRRENPSYLYREEQRRSLSEGTGTRGTMLSDMPALPAGVSCRTMTSVETIDARRALVSQRECIDGSGISHVSPGSRRVIKYYDE